MVTASHNPPRDNGYKVYLDDGAQIVPPADGDISARIDAVGPLASVPRAGEDITSVGDDLVEAYVAGALAQAGPGPRDLGVVYTPLHGVGRDLVVEVLTRAGFPPPTVVPRQGAPDPDFPTVAFPNPEEPGALDLALAQAAAEAADLVVANDPDADRLAVAVPDPGAAGAGARSAGTRSAWCWPTGCWPRARATTAWWRPPWCRRRCWPGWPRRGASTTPRP